MDKKNLVFQVGEPEVDVVTFQKQVISVKTHLSMDEVAKLVSSYVNEYFEVAEGNLQVLYAEYFFKSNIFELATDYTIQTEQFDELLSLGVLDEVMSKINNMKEIKSIINKTIEKMEKENSFETKFGLLIEKGTEAISKFSEFDFSKESVESLMDTLKEAKTLADKEEKKIYGEEG